METGTILLWAALIIGLVSIFFSLLDILTKKRMYKRIAQIAGLICFIFISLMLLLLTYYFLASDLHIHYVWLNTDVDYEWYYKLVGVWTGIEGTLLMWVWFISLSLEIEEFYVFRKNRKDKQHNDNSNFKPRNKSDSNSMSQVFKWVRLITVIIIIAFLGILISSDVFKPTEDITLSAPEGSQLKQIVFNPLTIEEEIHFDWKDGQRDTIDPNNPPAWAQQDVNALLASYGGYKNGNGINYLLLTPLMLVHPPVEFAAYAFTTIVLAAAFAFLISGNKQWIEFSLRWGRWAWLFYTLGLGLGALWAYVVLGWGGYWAWDPVETANLIPWIALTAFLHAQFQNRKNGDFKYLAAVIAISTFVLTILSRFVTKTGIWLASVHTFDPGDENLKDPVLRLQNVIENNDTALYLLLMMVIILIIAIILFSWRFLQTRFEEYSERASINKDVFIPMAVYIIFLIALLAFAIFDMKRLITILADISSTFGGGNQFLGIVILSIMVISIPVVWMVLTGEDTEDEDEESEKPATIFDKMESLTSTNIDRLNMYMTVALLSVGVIAVVAILFLGTNGVGPEDFDSKAPYVVLPLIAVLVVCLIWRALGKMKSLYIIGLMLLAGVIGFIIGDSYFHVSSVIGIGIPILMIGLGASVYKIFSVLGIRSTWKGIGKKMYMRLAGILLIITGILGMFLWSSSVSVTAPLFTGGDPSLVGMVTGYIISIIAFIAGISAYKGYNFEFAVFGAVCGILTIGMFVGVILGIIAFVLVILSQGEFKSKLNFRPVRTALRPLGAHLIHLGIVLIIIGYISSTFLFDEKESIILIKGEKQEFRGYEFKLVDSRGTDTDGNDMDFEIVEVFIEILKDGKRIGITILRWEYEDSKAHYVPDISIQHLLTEDIYFISLSFYTAADGAIPRLNQNPYVKFTSDDITSIALERIKILPMVSMLWGGLWIAVAGITLRIGVEYLPEKRRKPRDYRDDDYQEGEFEKDDVEGEMEDKTGEDKYYETLLERELAEVKGTTKGRKPKHVDKTMRKPGRIHEIKKYNGAHKKRTDIKRKQGLRRIK
jgi:cytochrome c-type biogenesis protein CcmF